MIELHAGSAQVSISPDDGGRLASVQVRGLELLVHGDTASNPLSWGSYPMAPWAGRINGGEFRFDDEVLHLPIVLGGHAIHGTVYLLPWKVLTADDTFASMSSPLGADWPFEGVAEQQFLLTATDLTCALSVTAGDRAMPVSIGWHPWFVKPLSDTLQFAKMFERAANGIPTGALVTPKPRPWDDCFIEPLAPLQLHYPEVSVTVTSDCPTWTVFDEPAHATCVEPQTHAPDEHNRHPLVLEPGQTLRRSMVIAWG